MGKSFRLITSLLLLLLLSFFSSTKQIEEEKDITTPLATNPTTTANSDSDASAVATTPLTIASPPRRLTTESWCVATENAAQIALQAALDYACGIVGAECLEIQEGGKCYNPNSLKAHASFAFNSYYHKNPIPNSCNFGGTAITITVDPSVGSCHFPSTSTSESILNITSEDGLGLFGRVPSTHPTPKPEASTSSSSSILSSLSTSILVSFVCFYPFVMNIYDLNLVM